MFLVHNIIWIILSVSFLGTDVVQGSRIAKLISKDLNYHNFNSAIKFSWKLICDPNGSYYYNLSVIACQGSSFQEVRGPETINQRYFQYDSILFEANSSLFTRIETLDAGDKLSLEFRFRNVTQDYHIDASKEVCLNTTRTSSQMLMARWAITPGSSEDCTCPLIRNFVSCSCIRNNETIFNVDYSEDNRMICWRNLTKEMNRTQFFLFFEEVGVCSTIRQIYWSGARVFISSAIKAEFFIVTFLNCWLLANLLV